LQYLFSFQVIAIGRGKASPRRIVAARDATSLLRQA
jgi:hypothetical protein